MKNNIEWIFFDVGSTLVNEEKVYCHRLQDIAAAAGEPFEKIYNMAIDLYKNNKKGDLELTRKYKVSGSKWYLEEEELFEDTEETLKALSQKYKIGIIANQSLGTADRLEKFGIKKYIDLIIASAEEGVEKPDKKIFNIALSKASCNPENAVMIGDRIDNDIIPAKELGMNTIWIKQGFGKYWNITCENEIPDEEMNSLSELKERFL